ncbi:hypothetical protein [Methanocaldococcus sp.]|uniref:hypothetical protein n=1 Tax=Methanocaldococcus sp. TaxID=2152917 RepID=UPI002603C8CB|nr:hypothetical protein [Methanocaldococcus sp.]MCQ6253367.1 hypothetical protein [Methanocaldococcus sp.]
MKNLDNVERIVKLLLMEKDFNDKEKLRDLYKEYIKTKDEISYLENILEDFETLDTNINHIKRYSEIVKSLLPKLSKFTNIPIFVDIVKMLETVDNIDTKELESLRWEINKEIEELNDKLKTIKNEIMAIVVNESLSKIGSSNLEEFLKYLENNKENKKLEIDEYKEEPKVVD